MSVTLEGRDHSAAIAAPSRVVPVGPISERTSTGRSLVKSSLITRIPRKRTPRPRQTWATANVGPANVVVDELVFTTVPPGQAPSTVLVAATHGRGVWSVDVAGSPKRIEQRTVRKRAA